MPLLKRLLLCLLLNLWCISTAAAGETHHGDGVAKYQFTLCPDCVPRLNAAATNGKALGRATVHAGLIAHGVARSAPAPLHEQVPPCLATVGSPIRAAQVDTVVKHSSTAGKVGLLRWVHRSSGVEKRLISPAGASAALNGTTTVAVSLLAGDCMQTRVPAEDGDDDGMVVASSGPESAWGETLPRAGDLQPSNALGDGWDAHPPAAVAFFHFVPVDLQLNSLNCSPVLSASVRTLDAACPAGCSPPPAFAAAAAVTAELSSDVCFHRTVLQPRSFDGVAALIMTVLADRVAGRSGRGRRSAVLAFAALVHYSAWSVAAAPWTEALHSNCTNDPNMPKRFRCDPRPVINPRS